MILLKADSCLLNQHSWGELRLALVFKWSENSLIAKKIDLRFNKNELVTNCDHLRNAIKFSYINPMVLQ